MEKIWYTENNRFEEIILTADIGGTNTNIGFIGRKDAHFSLILECLFDSREIDNLIQPMETALEDFTSKFPRPEKCCIAAAGPVHDNHCSITNLLWDIDGEQIVQSLGIPTVLINDFTALSYCLPVLDIDDPEDIIQIPHSGNTYPEPSGTTRCVIGAGTGLGVGAIVSCGDRYQAISSEGGHSLFSPFDEESFAITEYIHNAIGFPPGTEPFVSGQGLINLYHYYSEVKGMTFSGEARELLEVPDLHKPAGISRYCSTDKLCNTIMAAFFRFYGNFASTAALMFLSLGGTYIAGGIASKNADFLINHSQFMRAFESSYKSNISDLLRGIPVYIVKNYSSSLIGAANAAQYLLDPVSP